MCIRDRVTAEAKSIPLIYELAKVMKMPRYVIARKSVKGYMRNPIITTVNSITNMGREQILVVDEHDAEFIKGKKVAIIDDVISTGSSIEAIEKLVRESGGEVIARAAVLADNVRKWGVGNVAVTVNDPSQVARLEGWFDAVAVDAPCSGEGMFRKEAAATAQHNDGLVAHCAELGAEILENAAALLAPGGVLVYSTCTFAPDEDEGQIANFLAKHPEFTLCDLSACGFGRPGEGNRAPDHSDFHAEYLSLIHI